jgi:hypothetical protein
MLYWSVCGGGGGEAGRERLYEEKSVKVEEEKDF